MLIAQCENCLTSKVQNVFICRELTFCVSASSAWASTNSATKIYIFLWMQKNNSSDELPRTSFVLVTRGDTSINFTSASWNDTPLFGVEQHAQTRRRAAPRRTKINAEIIIQSTQHFQVCSSRSREWCKSFELFEKLYSFGSVWRKARLELQQLLFLLHTSKDGELIWYILLLFLCFMFRINSRKKRYLRVWIKTLSSPHSMVGNRSKGFWV